MTSLIINDSDMIKAIMEENATKETEKKCAPILIDGHVDLTYFMMNRHEDCRLSSLDEGPFTLEKMKNAGVKLFCNALYCEDQFNGEGSVRRLRETIKFTHDHFDEIATVTQSSDLESLEKDSGTIKTIPLLENADALAGNLSMIDELMEAGIRIVGLTHVGMNRLADGNAVFHSEGLSREGVEVIKALQKNGLLIDVAHLHPTCFRQLLDLVEAPIITSHTGIRSVSSIPRNLDQDQCGEIVSRDGVIGISFNPDMLSPNSEATLEDAFVHIDILVQKFGPEFVGIGSDFCGFYGITTGLEDITKISPLWDMMLKHGYGQDAVDKIMGLNWLRTFQKLY